VADLWHEPQTLALSLESEALIWRSTCPCGWASDEFPDEYGADMAGLDHDRGELWVDPVGSRAVAALHRDGIRLARGLSAAEMIETEARFGLTFAPDHHWMLRTVLPVGDGWPDWRSGDPDQLQALIDRPVEDLALSVAGGWWWNPWGGRPTRSADAERRAREHLARVPRLAPVSGERYLPCDPRLSGNPVLAWYSGDPVVLFTDLGDYTSPGRDAVERPSPVPMRRIPFWSDLLLAEDSSRPLVI
jgi:hypothetical protein